MALPGKSSVLRQGPHAALDLFAGLLQDAAHDGLPVRAEGFGFADAGMTFDLAIDVAQAGLIAEGYQASPNDAVPGLPANFALVHIQAF